MRLQQAWKTIIGFAFLGLAMGAAAYGNAALHEALHEYTKPMNGLGFALTFASMILCPPQLIVVLCIDCDALGWGGLVMYSVIGILNAALYAVIGTVVVSLRKQQATSTPDAR